MGNQPDPEDIDVFVGGVVPDPTADAEAERIIAESKARPDHRLKVEKAERILASFGIRAPDYGLPDAQSLLEHWHACVADLIEHDSHKSDALRADNGGPGGSSGMSNAKSGGGVG